MVGSCTVRADSVVAIQADNPDDGKFVDRKLEVGEMSSMITTYTTEGTDCGVAGPFGRQAQGAAAEWLAWCLEIVEHGRVGANS